MPNLVQSVGVLAVLIATGTSAAHGDPATLQQRAETALANDQPRQALTIAGQLLAENPNSFPALFVQALALSELGEDARAARVAAQAYDAATSHGEKLQAARLAAGARFNAEHFTRAEWWLRQAANHVQSAEDQTTIVDEFAAIRARNPLAVRLGFSIAPSNNINGGSEDSSLFLGEFELILPPESLALSGVEYTGEAQLSYRISESARQITSLGAYIYGRTYSLSDDAQSRGPDLSGSDYALTQAEASITHRRILGDGLGPTTIAAHFGAVRYGGAPLWDYQKLSVAQDAQIGTGMQVGVQGSVQDQRGRDGLQPDTMVYDLAGVYALQFANQDVLQIALTRQLNDTGDIETTFTQTQLSADYGFAQPVLGTRITATVGVGRVDYDEFFLSLDGRRDRSVTLGASAVFDGISYYGFSPSISLSATQTKSNVSQFSTTELQGRVGLQSNF